MFYAASSELTPWQQPSLMVDKTKEPVTAQPPRRAAERRTEPRYRFTAAAELLEENSGTQTEARIADISQREY